MGLIVHSSPTQESLMAPEVAVVLEGYTYFECPRWHENRIWVSDFYTYQVISACEDGTDIRVEAEVPGQPSGLGWLPDGRLLVVSMRDQKILRRESDGELVVHADLSGYVSANVNDMLVDGTGTSVRGQLRVRSDEPGPGRDGRSPPRRPGRIGARRRARSPLPQRNGSDVDRRSARGRNAGKSNQCVCRPGRRLSG